MSGKAEPLAKVKLGAKAAKVGKVAVKALKAEKTLNKAVKVAKVTGEVLGKGKTLALKAMEKIPKIHLEKVYIAGLRTAEGVEIGGFKYYKFAMKAGEKEGGKIAENVAEKFAKEIEQSRAAYKRAVEVAEEMKAKAAKYRDKTFASNGSRTMSGWTGKTTKAPEGIARKEPDEVMKHCENIGHDLKANGNDQGILGRYNASHAEKQLSLLTEKPIGVSKEMCQDCQKYFQKHAIDTEAEKFVTDPEMTRIFHPNGNVTKILW